MLYTFYRTNLTFILKKFYFQIQFMYLVFVYVFCLNKKNTLDRYNYVIYFLSN